MIWAIEQRPRQFYLKNIDTFDYLRPIKPMTRRTIMREFEVRIRFQGSVTTVRVKARDSSQAKALVKAEYGNQVTILSAKPAR